MTDLTKRCSICHVEFPATPEYFRRSSKARDGLKARCKSCSKRGTETPNDKVPDNTISCAICGLVCKSQIPASHLQAKHEMTTTEYKAMGYNTLSPARRNQLVQQMQVAEIKRNYGPDHPNWKGGHVDGSGYKVISRLGHTNLYEHRVIAEQKIGRPLLPNEVVHHKDGNRLNNDPDNLEVMDNAAHTGLEATIRVEKRFNIHPETYKTASILRDLGWNNASIARALNRNPSTIKRILRDVNRGNT